MPISRSLQGFLLATVILISTAAQAAYPTTGGSSQVLQVHPVPMLDPQDVVEAFSREYPEGDFSLVADLRTRSLVVMAPPTVHADLEAFVTARTADRMRRYVVDMEVIKEEGSSREVVGAPRLELPEGEIGRLNLNGNWVPGGPAWSSGLRVRPRQVASGRIRLQVEGYHATDETASAGPTELDLRPGEVVTIDPESSRDPALRALAERINAGSEGARFSVRLSVRPL